MTDRANGWPNRAPFYCAGYLCFTVDHATEAAAQRFEEIHGYRPEYLFESKGHLYAGPVPEVEAQT